MTRDQALEFRFEWENVPGVRAPELRATWARLEVWVNADCASLVEERATGAARRSIYGALYPLAEWIAFNWWLLCSHTRVGEGAVRQGLAWPASGEPALPSDWWHHHNVRAAGDGQAWPDLAIVPSGETTYLQWRADRESDPSLPVRFIGHGEAALPSQSVQAGLGQLVESVLTRLAEQGVSDTSLAKEWEAVRTADDAEAAFCQAAARLGFDPYSVTDDQAASIIRAGHDLERPLLDDFLNSVTPTRLADGLDWVERASRRLAQEPPVPDGLAARLADLSSEPAGGADVHGRPWVAGYRQAQHVRVHLGVPPTHPFPVEELVGLARKSCSDPRLIGLAGRTGDRSGTLVIGRRLHVTSQRFAQARALWHLTHERHARRFLLGPIATDRHRTGRAFAAELLAPAEGIRAQLNGGGDIVSDDAIASISRHFKTSELVIVHQIENQLGLTVGDV